MTCHLMDNAFPRPWQYTPGCWVCAPCRSIPFQVIWVMPIDLRSPLPSSASLIATFLADNQSLVRGPCRNMSHPEFLFQTFEKARVQGAQRPCRGAGDPAWGAGNPRKTLFSSFARRRRRRERRVDKAGDTPATPARGGSPLATPLEKRHEQTYTPVHKIRDDSCFARQPARSDCAQVLTRRTPVPLSARPLMGAGSVLLKMGNDVKRHDK